MESMYMLREIRGELADSVEEIGAALGLLRSAISDVEAGDERGGRMCGDDAMFVLSDLEGRFSAMSARLARWSQGVYDEEVGV
jgi:hypothetical protein